MNRRTFLLGAASSAVALSACGGSNLPKVLMLGDSIQFGVFTGIQLKGYADRVRKVLAGVVEVYDLGTNTSSSGFLLQHVQGIRGGFDVVVVNAGIHDMFFDVPVFDYWHNVREVLGLLKANNQYVLWASTTPVAVDEDRIDCMNQTVRGLTEDIGIDVIRLDLVADPALRPPGDEVHFNEEGTNILGDWVAGRIRELI